MSAAGPPSPSGQGEFGMVVELCGLPGAGKTTIAGALAEQLQAQGIDAAVVDGYVSASAPVITRLFHKTLSVMVALGSDPAGETRAARSLGSGQASLRDTLAVPVLWWARKRVLAQSKRSSGVAIVEEGLVQALWSAGLRATATSPTTLVGLADSATLPDVVVHVDVPHRVALGRLASRLSKHSRVQKLSVSDRLPLMLRGNVMLSEILGEWRRRSLSGVVVIDGTAPDCVTRLAADLLELRRLPPSRSV